MKKKKKISILLTDKGKINKKCFLPTRFPDATYVKSEWLQEELTCLKITFFSYGNIFLYLFLAVKLNYISMV